MLGRTRDYRMARPSLIVRAMRILRSKLAHTFVALAASAALGCPSGGTADAGTFLDTPGGGDGAPIPCGGDVIFAGSPTENLEVGALDNGTFTAWRNGQEVPFVWGPQGGTMIVPTLRAESSLNRPGNQCVVVEIQNLEPMGGTAFAEFRTFAIRTNASRDGSQFVVRDLFDQLGRMEFPRGTPLTIDVTLRGSQAAAHARLDLSVVPVGTPIPAHCEALPTTGSGCRYREIPATGLITAIRPATPTDAPGCPAQTSTAMTVQYELTVDPTYQDCTLAEPRTLTLNIEGYAVPEACLSRNMLRVGSTFAATYSESFAGTCSPFSVSTRAFEASPCTTECMP